MGLELLNPIAGLGVLAWDIWDYYHTVKALGQYVLYRQILNEMRVERSLYLAVSQATFNSVFAIELGQILLKNQVVKLIVFNAENEAIAQWIPS